MRHRDRAPPMMPAPFMRQGRCLYRCEATWEFYDTFTSFQVEPNMHIFTASLHRSWMMQVHPGKGGILTDRRVELYGGREEGQLASTSSSS